MTRSELDLLVAGGLLAATLAGGVAAPAAAQDPAASKHALIFGVNRYRDTIAGVPELKFAVADAKELERLLEDQLWDARGFFDEEVTRRTIVEELVRLAATARQQDTVLIYFAGHGVRDAVGRRHTYWLTYPSTISDLAVEGIRLSHLLEYIQDIPADRKIVLLDHCNSGDVARIGLEEAGGARGGAGEPSLTPATSRDLFPEAEVTGGLTDDAGGLVILGSARDEAYEFEEIGHGLFTHGLLQALDSADADTDGDRKLSLSELWTRAQQEMDKVKRDVPAAAGIVQVPVEILSGSGLMGWKLFDAVVSSPVDAASLVQVLAELEQETDLALLHAGLALAMALQAVSNWEASTAQGIDPNPADQAVVDRLRVIRDLPSTVGWSARKNMLVFELRQQELIPDEN